MKELILKDCKWVEERSDLKNIKNYFAEFIDSEGKIYQLDLLPIIRSVTSSDITETMRKQLENTLRGKKFIFMDIGIVLDIKRVILKALF